MFCKLYNFETFWTLHDPKAALTIAFSYHFTFPWHDLSWVSHTVCIAMTKLSIYNIHFKSNQHKVIWAQPDNECLSFEGCLLLVCLIEWQSVRRTFPYLCILRTGRVFWLTRTVLGKYNQSETFSLSPGVTAYYWRSANTRAVTDTSLHTPNWADNVCNSCVTPLQLSHKQCMSFEAWGQFQHGNEPTSGLTQCGGGLVTFSGQFWDFNEQTRIVLYSNYGLIT